MKASLTNSGLLQAFTSDASHGEITAWKECVMQDHSGTSVGHDPQHDKRSVFCMTMVGRESHHYKGMGFACFLQARAVFAFILLLSIAVPLYCVAQRRELTAGEPGSRTSYLAGWLPVYVLLYLGAALFQGGVGGGAVGIPAPCAHSEAQKGEGPQQAADSPRCLQNQSKFVNALVLPFLSQGGAGGGTVGIISNLRSFIWVPVGQDAYRWG
eukprot:873480-Pelagomonas_calceolata.AAC.2